MHTTSPSLLMRLRQPGQTEAWSQFVHLYSPMLYSWAKRLSLRDEDARDLVQEVFANLVQKLPEFEYDNQKRFRTWLRTMTLNKWRDRQRRKRLPLDNRVPPEELPAPAVNGVEETELCQHLMRQLLPSLRERFQPTTWTDFIGLVVEGRTGGQVAEELGMTEAAVYKAKLRVMSCLHRELADLIEER